MDTDLHLMTSACALAGRDDARWKLEGLQQSWLVKRRRPANECCISTVQTAKSRANCSWEWTTAYLLAFASKRMGKEYVPESISCKTSIALPRQRSSKSGIGFWQSQAPFWQEKIIKFTGTSQRACHKHLLASLSSTNVSTGLTTTSCQRSSSQRNTKPKAKMVRRGERREEISCVFVCER